jgi:solute carrier family 29 (equilibrative nucleoside transporter), member 1/2/3
VFPPITLAVRPISDKTNPLIFTGTHFLLFNIGDFSGRLLCSFPRLLIWSQKRVLAFSLARTLFIPAFLACNVPGSTAPLSDGMFFFLLLIFGITNGYGGTMSMIIAPSVERNPRLRGRREDVDTAATVASFCLVGGLCIGAFASFMVRGIMCGCNPFLSG